MDTAIREGYAKKGKVLGKTMKKKYLLLRCASQKSMNAQLEVYDDHKQVRKKSSPNSVIFMKSVAGVKRIEAPVAFGSTLKDCGCFIRLDVSTDRGGVEEVYLSLDNRDLFEDWLTDLEFLVRLPDLIIPLPYVPKRGLPLITQTSIDKKLLGDIDFEDACPVETLQTELGLKWQLNNRIFILVLTRTTLVFLDPLAGIHALTYNIQNLRRCGHWQKLVFIESGRRTDTGPGYLWLYIHSMALAKNFYTTLSNVMGSTQQLMVIQKHLCWDKFREELPPGSTKSLVDSRELVQGPVADNDTYGIESLEYVHTSADISACPPLPPNHPNANLLPPPPGHQVTHPPPPLMKSSDSQSHRSAARQEDNILPLTPLDSMKRRASLPGRDQRFTDKEASIGYRADTFSGVHVKTRYDMLVPEDTHDLHVGTNGQVETKYNFANTDGKGNIINAGSKRPEHSYYDVNDIISELSGYPRSPTPNTKRGSLKNDGSSKFNTISIVKLSSTSFKEKVGRSTFYKTSLPTTEPSGISPYALFSDLDTQVPPEVRRERIRQLSLRQNFTMENTSNLGTPLSPEHVIFPSTPLVLYATPQNIPVDAHYKLVDPKPRSVLFSSSSLPALLSEEDTSIYNSPNNFPVNQDYQHPLSNAQVLPAPSENIGSEENKPILDMRGGYDTLKANGDDGIIFLEDSKTFSNVTDVDRTHSPIYEKMESGKNISPEANAVSQEMDDIAFAFSMTEFNIDNNSLGTLIESPLMDTSLCDGEIGDPNEGAGQGSYTDINDNNRNVVTAGNYVPMILNSDESTDCDLPETIDRVQKKSSQANVEDVFEKDSQEYETMADLTVKKTFKTVNDSLVNNRYQNIYPFNKPPPLTSNPTSLLRRESSPQVTHKQNPVLENTAKSFAFSRGSSSDGQSIYYAELDLCKDDKSTVVVKSIHASGPSTYYDKIDHKLSNILQETVQHHRETNK